jgi:YD repeat-containing protein
MMDKHIHNVPIESVVKKNGNVMSADLNTFKVISPMPDENFIVADAKYNLYTSTPIGSGGFTKYRVYTSSTHKDAGYEADVMMDHYNLQGKLIQYHQENDADISYIYDASGKQVIAEVFNAKAGIPECKKTQVRIPIYNYGARELMYPVNISHPQQVNLYFLEYRYLDSYPSMPYELVIELENSQGRVVGGDYIDYNKRVAGFNVDKAGVYVLRFRLNRPLAFLAHLESDQISYTYPRNNEIFYTSFEDVTGAVPLSKAKTGDFAYKKAFGIDTRNFAPGNYELSYWKSTNGVNWSFVSQTRTIGTSANSISVGSSSYYIDELRLIPKDARIKTFTVKKGIGLSSETDHNGVSTYYEYDEFGRLKRVLDNDRNVRKEYDYSYVN